MQHAGARRRRGFSPDAGARHPQCRIPAPSHFLSVSGFRLLKRSTYLLFPEHVQAREKWRMMQHVENCMRKCVHLRGTELHNQKLTIFRNSQFSCLQASRDKLKLDDLWPLFRHTASGRKHSTYHECESQLVRPSTRAEWLCAFVACFLCAEVNPLWARGGEAWRREVRGQLRGLASRRRMPFVLCTRLESLTVTVARVATEGGASQQQHLPAQLGHCHTPARRDCSRADGDSGSSPPKCCASGARQLRAKALCNTTLWRTNARPITLFLCNVFDMCLTGVARRNVKHCQCRLAARTRQTTQCCCRHRHRLHCRICQPTLLFFLLRSLFLPSCPPPPPFLFFNQQGRWWCGR